MTQSDNKVSAKYVIQDLFRGSRPRKMHATKTNANRQTGVVSAGIMAGLVEDVIKA